MPTLTWAGKEEATRTAKSVSYRMLERDDSLSYGDLSAENVIVQGDNLSALKAILPYYRGRVRCVYIDPPYNTGAAFEHYDDNVEHGTWLSLMYSRLELLRELLSDDGSIWVTLDDSEVFYCKVIMDEIFGRGNFVGSIVWEKADSPKMDPKFFSTSHDLILVYANNTEKLVINREFSEDIPEHYNKIDELGNRYYLKPMRVMGGNVSDSLYYPMTAPDGTVVYPISSKGEKTCWRWSKKKVEEEFNRIEWVNGRNGWSLYFRIYAETRKGMPIRTIWHHQEVGTNRTSKAEIKALFGTDTFDTPKPEKLLQKIINATTNPGDIVLDSFLGSGTTAAVAHKMNRRYVGIEIGDHAVTHVVPRLRKVIDGEQGGISKAENWQGGGGFSFYRLGEEVFTAEGKIKQGVKFAVLAAHIWMTETKLPYLKSLSPNGESDSPLIGINDGVAYYLLYNGILRDKRPNGGNVLTKKVLASLPPHEGTRIIYGESSRIHEDTLKSMGIIFKQTPKAIRED